MGSRFLLRSAAGRLWRNEDGASAVEFAIVGAVLVVTMLAVIQIGWALQIRNELGKAADEAIRFVMLDPDMSDADFEDKADDTLLGYDPDRLVVEAGEIRVDETDFRTLSIEYEIPVSVPGLPLSVFTLSVERRIPELES